MELERMGLRAAEALKQAAKDPDAEIARHASDLLARLDEQLKTLKQLTPKKVNLKLSDVPVADAVKELAKQSGYSISLDEKAKPARVSLETGEMSFWEAFDQLCLACGLVEAPANDKAANFTLAEGKPKPVPTSYVGAARIRLLTDSVTRKDAKAEITLEIAVEPRLRQAKITSGATIEGALDENGKPIAAGESSAQSTEPRHTVATLKLDPKQHKLNELYGSLPVEAFTGNKAAIDQPAKNVGKTIDLSDGAVFRLDAFDKKENGEVSMQGTVTKAFAPGGKIVIRGGFNDYRPELIDARGNPFGLTVTATQTQFNGRSLTTRWTLTCRPHDKDVEAMELTVQANEEKKSALSIPFSFKDVTVP